MSGQELGSVVRGMGAVNKAIYPKNPITGTATTVAIAAREKIMAQIPETPGGDAIESKPREKTFGQKVMPAVGNMVEAVQKSTIVQTIKNVFSRKNKTPVVSASSSPEAVKPSTQSAKEAAVPQTPLTKEQKAQVHNIGQRARANAMSSNRNVEIKTWLLLAS